MAYSCVECGQEIDVVGDGIAVMHRRIDPRVGPESMRRWMIEFTRREYAAMVENAREWCTGSGKLAMKEEW